MKKELTAKQVNVILHKDIILKDILKRIGVKDYVIYVSTLEELIDKGYDIREYLDVLDIESAIVVCNYEIAGVDLSDYIDKEFNYGQLRLIGDGLKDGLDVGYYAKPSMGMKEMWEILQGLREGLDVSIFAKDCFNYRQMFEIRQGLVEKLDVTKYAREELNDKEMHEIRNQLYCWG